MSDQAWVRVQPGPSPGLAWPKPGSDPAHAELGSAQARLASQDLLESIQIGPKWISSHHFEQMLMRF